MRVRSQHFPPGSKKASVQIISLDVFCARARRASGFTKTRRELLAALLNLPLEGYGEPAAYLYVGDYVFWLEQ